MHPGVEDMLRSYLGRPDREGRHSSMYRDTGGATVGIGCQFERVSEVLRLPWTRRDRRAWQSAAEKNDVVTREYARVCAGGSGSAGPDSVVLSGPAIDNLFHSRAIDHESILRRLFREWDDFPADAQLGILHHSWIRSSVAGIESWHDGRYAAAVRARRWRVAGDESLWEDLREGQRPRLVSRRNDVLRMFRNASLVDETHGAVPVRMLFFPREADSSVESVTRRAATV